MVNDFTLNCKHIFNHSVKEHPALLVFSVTLFKIDQNQNRSMDQNVGNERRYIYKDPRQDSEEYFVYEISEEMFYPNLKRFVWRRHAGAVLSWMSSNMADGNQQKHLLPCLATKA